MRIKNENDTKVTAYATRQRGGETDVLTIAKYSRGEWSIGSSSCFPTNIDDARDQLAAMNAAFEEIALIDAATN